MKPYLNLKSTTALRVAAVAMAIGAAPMLAHANPMGGVVAAGTATINNTTPQQMDINQSSNKAIINWDSFDIAPNETTNFHQPSANAAALNRIGSANPSRILGSLNANGQIMLVNPNGVFFGRDSTVDVGGLLATTADISNNRFMNGNYAFSRAGNPNAEVTNNGSITVRNGGMAALVAPSAANNGTINANLGKVAVAGTDVFTLDPFGDNLVNFALPGNVTRSGPLARAAEASNNGSIFADRGTVQMTAQAARAAVDSSVNMDGIIQAQNGVNRDGKVFLSADNVNIGGSIDTSGRGPNAGGGTVDAVANDMLSFSGDINADSNAASNQQGGDVTLQGDTLALGGTVSSRGAGGAFGGKATFKAGDTMDIGSSEAYTLSSALGNTGFTEVAANDTINVNSDIAEASNDGQTMNFADGDANGDLTVNLDGDVGMAANQTLQGDATRVNVGEAGSVQDGVDVASTAGANVRVENGTFDEDVTVAKDNINLHGQGNMDSVIDGYVNVTGDNANVHHLGINGGDLDGTQVGVNVDGAGGAHIHHNAINVEGDGGVGVSLNDAPDALVNANDITADTGVSVNDSFGARVAGNTVDVGTDGISVADSGNAVIRNNSINGEGEGTGVSLVDSSNALVANNSISDFDTAVELEDSANARVNGNDGVEIENGLVASNADNLRANGNTFTGNDDGSGVGFDLTDSSNVRLTNNDADDFDEPIMLDNSNLSVDTGNNF